MTSPSRPQTLVWPLLIELMCAPVPTDVAFTGTIRTTEREVTFGFAGGPGGPPLVVAPLADASGTSQFGVTMHGENLRLDFPSGEPYLIAGAGGAWVFRPGEHVPDHSDLESLRPAGMAMHLVTRPDYDRFVGNDFAKPDGPITATTFLGREAWRLTLKPPSHKPYPLHWIVDAETGMLLRQANDGVGKVAEWTSFEVVGPVPASTFTWNGPVRERETRAQESERMHEEYLRQQDERRRELIGDAQPELHVIAHPSIEVSHSGDDGTIEAMIGSPHGTLMRSPIGGASGPNSSAGEDSWMDDDADLWPAHTTTYEWQSGPWEWTLAFHDNVTLTPESLRSFQEQIGAVPDI